MAKTDPFWTAFQAFNEANGGGVTIRKVAKGYSLFREDTGAPVARLRPTGSKDQVEVMWWSRRDKWEQIGDIGPVLMPLDQALEYVAQDPEDIFWH